MAHGEWGDARAGTNCRGAGAAVAPQWRGLALNDVCAEAALVAPGAEDVAIYHVTATLAATTRVIFTRAALTPVSTAIPARAHTVSQARGKAACQGQGVPAHRS